MMQEKRVSRNGQSEQALRYLLCDKSGPSESRSAHGEMVRSPIQCLDKAVDERPGIIAVRFVELPIREREALVELCAALKRNSHTKKTPVTALLHAKHRKLMKDLERAGVDFVRFIGETDLSSTLMLEILDGLGPDDRIEGQLAVICPYLHYDPIDALHEMRVCGAYLDRMVLGGHWLHEVCETARHLQCEYFLHPRVKS
jgi:hypothetical protein